MLDFYITRDPEIQDEDASQYFGGAEFDEWDAIFQEALPDYPLLSRAEDCYADAWFAPEEFEQLRIECLRAKACASDQVAANVLTELIHACDEARVHNWGVWLACD